MRSFAIVEQIARTKRFQSNAQWSVDTTERRLVVNVERKPLRMAAAIVTFLNEVVDEARRDSCVAEFADLHREAAVYIAKRPWFDLVCSQDFFGPRMGCSLQRCGPIAESEHSAASPVHDVRRCEILSPHIKAELPAAEFAFEDAAKEIETESGFLMQ